MLNPDLNLFELTNQEYEVYNKHLILPQIQIEGQKRLKVSKVLCIGAGGLGSSVLTYLVSSGIGNIGIVDYDKVEFSNLPRQTIYSLKDINLDKVICAKQNLSTLNIKCKINIYNYKLNVNNGLKIIKKYDLIIDCTDNFEVRLLINDICFLLGKTLIFGAVMRFEGQVSIFNYQSSTNYKDLYFIDSIILNSQLRLCNSGGVFSFLPSIIGILELSEAIKVITGYKTNLVEKVISVNLLNNKFKQSRLRTGIHIKYNNNSNLYQTLYNSVKLYFKHFILDVNQISIPRINNYNSKFNINIVSDSYIPYMENENLFYIPLSQLKNFLLKIKSFNISYINLIFVDFSFINYYKAYMIIRQMNQVFCLFSK